MRRANYDQKILSTFEIISCYFADVYYNHIYGTSKDALNRGDGTSLTDIYKKYAKNYLYGFSNQEDRYRQTVNKLHMYFQSSTRYTAISFSEFIDKILQHLFGQGQINILFVEC